MFPNTCSFCARSTSVDVAQGVERAKRLVLGPNCNICERCLFAGISYLAEQTPSVMMAVAFDNTTTVGQLLAIQPIEEYLSKVGIDPSGMTVCQFFEALQKAFARTVEVMESKSGPDMLGQHIKALEGECAEKRTGIAGLQAEIVALEKQIAEVRVRLAEIEKYALVYTAPPTNPHENTNPDITPQDLSGVLELD